MNVKSFNALKTVFVMLMSLEFLAPTFVSDLLPGEKSDLLQQRILNIAKQKNPILLFNEETDDEVRQRDVQTTRTNLSLTIPVATHLRIQPTNDHEFTWRIPVHVDLHFDTRPPVFKLHRILLI